MEILRKLRWVLYPIAFLLVFLFAGYCTFPSSVLRELAQSSIGAAAMGMGPRTRGVPEVTIKNVSLWRLSGISLQELKILWPAVKETESPMVVELNSLKGRMGIFAFLTGGRRISADINLYGGEIITDFKVRSKNAFDYVNISGSKVNLAKMTFLETLLGAPIEGIINLSVDLKANNDITKEGSGAIKLNFESLAFGPGVITLPAGGFVSSLTVPKLNLGKLTADLTLSKGTLESKTFSLNGGDVEADLTLSIVLGKNPNTSRVNGDGWFSVKREFVNSNETIKMLFDLIPELRTAQLGDGKVGISVRGTLGRPQVKLERATGARKDAKKNQVATRGD